MSATTKYSSELIILFDLPGSPVPSVQEIGYLQNKTAPVVGNQIEALKVKQTSKGSFGFEKASQNDFNPFAGLDTESRLYLWGHGNWAACTLGGASPGQVAGLLLDHGLQPVSVISLIACNLGADSDYANPQRVLPDSPGIISFANELMQHLGAGWCKKHKSVQTVLYARTYAVSMYKTGQKLTWDAYDPNEFKGTPSVQDLRKANLKLKHRRTGSKYCFYFENGVPDAGAVKAKPVLYEDPKDEDY
jgi:hypothetical protein